MNKDGVDTMVMDETQWQATHVDDVFLPSVRVQLTWKNVEAAVERGAVVPQQAHALWAGWASPTSGLRVGAGLMASAEQSTTLKNDHDLESSAPDLPGPLERHGLGLVVGLLVGAGGAWWALGG